jgi:hypothetical protein
VDVIKFRPLFLMQNVQLPFERPIINWTEVAPKFFDMILTSVGARIPVLVNQFSTSTTGRVSDFFARYSIYGGNSTITLFPDKLVFDFPQLNPPDVPLVGDLLRTVHDALSADFLQASYSRIDIQVGEHLELVPPSTVTEFLNRYRIKGLDEVFVQAEAVVEPAVRFSAKSSKPPWSCTLMVEQSLMNAAAIFLWESTSLTDANSVPSFDDKFRLVAHIGGLALKALNLEHVDVDTE